MNAGHSDATERQGRSCQVSLFILTPEGALAPHLCENPVPPGHMYPICPRCSCFLNQIAFSGGAGFQRASALLGAAGAREARS